MKNIAILTSGGDAPGMNTCVHSVFMEAAHHGVALHGVEDGFQGLIEDRIFLIEEEESLRNANRGGTYLGTARSKDFLNPEYRAQAIQNLKNRGIEALIVIGGDGSYMGALALCREFGFPVVGIPGTIDNDIAYTDYTIGFDTALNTIIEAADKILDTAQAHHRLFLVEVMGRNSGSLALNAGIACNADMVLIPEKQTGLEELVQYIPNRSVKKTGLIVVAEGDEQSERSTLVKAIELAHPALDVRYTVLGHIQRGGNPSYKDRFMAVRMGVKAVQDLIAGVSGQMISYKEGRLQWVDLNKILTPEASKERMDKLIHNALFSGEIL